MIDSWLFDFSKILLIKTNIIAEVVPGSIPQNSQLFQVHYVISFFPYIINFFKRKEDGI